MKVVYDFTRLALQINVTRSASVVWKNITYDKENL